MTYLYLLHNTLWIDSVETHCQTAVLPAVHFIILIFFIICIPSSAQPLFFFFLFHLNVDNTSFSSF